MPRLSHTPLMLVALFIVSGVGFFCYSYLTRTPSPPSETGGPVATATEEPASWPEPAETTAPASQPAETAVEQANSLKTVAANAVAKWTVDATGDDSAARAAAITALATAARSQALPVLRKVLTSGVADDRQLALGSLGTLAREQGDADQGIRNVLRETIYHGDDDDIMRTARATLDDVEGDLEKTPSRTPP